MSDNWFENMDNGEITGLISVDIRKAFDFIDHKILLRKMQDQFGVQEFELKWFQSYLTKRSQVCVVDGHTSLAKEIVCGVPQGSILGQHRCILSAHARESFRAIANGGL